MKKIYLLLCLIITAGCSQAQTPADKTTIPAYHILTTDSVYVTPANLNKHKPVMVIYFAPDCSHCQHLMYDMKNELPKLKNVQIVMITFVLQLRAIQVFQRDFDLAKYHNITVGTEGYTYFVQKYYNIHNTPYIAIYDKNGKLSQAFEKVPKIPDLMAALKKV